MSRLGVSASALLLTACAAVPPAEPQPQVVGAGECRGEDLARFNGQPATQQLGAELLRASGARVLRWVQPGMAVTMDYRTDRLTVELDAQNRLVSARCG